MESPSAGVALGRQWWRERLETSARWRGFSVGTAPVLWVAVWLGGPYLMLFVVSLWRVDYITIVRDWGLRNYATIFTEGFYLRTLLKSVAIGAATTTLATLIAFPLAYFIAFKVRRRKLLLYVLVIVPLWVSYLVRAYAWKVILGREGILNGFLEWVGVIHRPLSFLLYSPFAVILTLTHIFTPFMVLTTYSTLERLPPSLIEASKDLGVGRWGTFRRVTLPLALPGVLAGATFTLGLSSGDFVAPLLVGGPNGVMVANLIASQFGATYNWPLGSALGFLMLLFIMVLVSLSGYLERREQLA
jgi:spermidine/putrescine transport system permease protein